MLSVVLKGNYDNKSDMYVAEFTAISNGRVHYTSTVLGRTCNSNKLMEKLGYIKAFEHAVDWALSRQYSAINIVSDCDLSFLCDKSRLRYPEEVGARKYFKGVEQQIKIYFNKDV